MRQASSANESAVNALLVCSSCQERIAQLNLLREEVFVLRSRVIELEQRAKAFVGLHVPSAAQQRLWFLQQFSPQSTSYNMPLALRLKGPLDTQALKKSINAIWQRHEILRTSFPIIDGRPMQAIAAANELAIGELDLTDYPRAELEEQILRLALKEADEPFDLNTGPLFRFRLLRAREHDHVLLATLHHIIADGWSVGVFFAELTQLYAAYRENQPNPLPPLPRQYHDYAEEEQQWLTGSAAKEELAYWRRQLADLPDLLELPSDAPRAVPALATGCSSTFHLRRGVADEVLGFCRRERCTPFMFLLAVFQVLLCRYTGKTDILVGSPVSNRKRTEYEALIGCFLNTLVFRGRLTHGLTLREFLRQTRQTAIDAYARQDFPFDRLVQEIRPDRATNQAPIFQLLFVMQNASGPPPAFLELETLPVDIPATTAAYDLTLSVSITREGLHGLFRYRSDVFSPDTISRIAEHYRVLIRSAITNPDAMLSDLAMIAPQEAARLRRYSAGPPLPARDPQLAHEAFQENAARSASAIALVCDGVEITYDDLNRKANRLARRLQKLGVGRESLVGVLLERSVEAIASILAILKTGAAYLPLEPSLPRERLAYILEDAEVAHVVTAQTYHDLLPGSMAHIVHCDDEEGFKSESSENLPTRTGRTGLAYLIYTSGSTGRPKGVMVEHDAVAARLADMQLRHKLSPSDRLLQRAPLGFDVSVWEILWPLSVGARLVLARPKHHADPTYLTEVICAQGVTVVCFVPSLLQLFLEHADIERCRTLRLVISGAETLTPDLVQRFFQRFSCPLFNYYGPTEACLHVTCWQCRADDLRPSVPIGRPIAGTLVRVLDADRQPVAIGIPGELYLGGVGLARGYWHRPDLTDQRFRSLPSGTEGSARLYCSGDLGRVLSDGAIEFLGRVDQQVKIRGYRIELGEVESALLAFGPVARAVVDVRSDLPGGKQLVAYLVPQSQQAIRVADLRDFLRLKLPEYMIPSRFVQLAEFPQTSSGKIDRGRLPRPPVGQATETVTSVTPGSDNEKLLCDIFAGLLGLDKVDPRDNFFDLGGDSLQAMKAILRIRDVLHVQLSVPSFFETPSPAGVLQSLFTPPASVCEERGPSPA
jgi:amino acid adenylation domain-containing protein